MAIKAVLFDLDGTLLPMDQEVFTKAYFKLLAKKVAPIGYEPQRLISAVWSGTGAMVKNDGRVLNEEAFWDKFTEIYGKKAIDDKPAFDDFYYNEFQQAKDYCGYNDCAKKTVYEIKNRGYRVALATNPIFPSVATESRIKWAGLRPEDFELYTTYENIGYCKPNLDYYKEIVKRLQLYPEECLMVGNDVTEDMVAEQLDMKVFLLTDCLINKNNDDITKYSSGSFEELSDFVKKFN